MNKQKIGLNLFESGKGVFKIALRIILICSGISLCLGLLSLYGSGVKGMAGSAIIACLFWMYLSKVIFFQQIELLPLILSIGITLATQVNAWRYYPISHKYIICSSLAIIVSIYSVIVFLKSLLLKLIEGKEDKKFYLLISIISLLFIVILYSLTNQLYEQYDLVYSMDGGWVFNEMYPNLNYYDIRHPLISILYFPIYSFCCYALKLCRTFSETNLAITLQIIQVQLMITTALMLSKITNNRWTKYIYIVSGPFIINVFFFEKFPLVMFLLVLAVYFYKFQDKRARIAVALATGSILTSCVIAISCLLDHRINLLERIRELSKTILFSLAFCVSFGKVRTLLHGFEEAYTLRTALGALPFKQKLYSYLNMIGSSIISISPDIKAGNVWWIGLTTSLNYLALILVALMVLGYIQSKSKLEVRISAVWMMFSLILIMIAGWSITESPLFAIYFSWAAVILVQNGLILFYKIIPEKSIYITCCTIIFILNLSTNFQVIFSLL